jgi:tetratricopeptide (TPR) repeat protein
MQRKCHGKRLYSPKISMISFALSVALLLTVGPAPTEFREDPAMDAAQRRHLIESRLEANDPGGAVAVGERAVREFPDNSALWLSLGEAYGEKARSASVVKGLPLARKCKAAFEKAVALDPANADARVALFTYCLEAPAVAGGGLSLARAQAGEIAKLDLCRGHLAGASLASRENDLPKEEAELRLAIETARGPEELADAKCQLALRFERLGKKPEAIDALREALKLHPGHSQAKSELKRLGG